MFGGFSRTAPHMFGVFSRTAPHMFGDFHAPRIYILDSIKSNSNNLAMK